MFAEANYLVNLRHVGEVKGLKMNPVLAIEAVTPVLKPVLTDGLADLNINVHLFQPRWCYLSFASPHQVVNYSIK